jgi:hypothetical protein
MKKFRMILMAFAFIFAVGSVYATMFAQSGFYNVSPGVAAAGTITTPVGNTPVCAVQTGTQCLIRVGAIDKPAYSTSQAAAIQNANFLLRYQ